MTTQTTTIDAVLARHAQGIAFVAEERPATTVSDFTDQLRTAAENFEGAGINGFEELEIAAIYLGDAAVSEGADLRVLLNSAAKYLANATDMVDEYRLML